MRNIDETMKKLTNIIRKTRNKEVFIPNIFLELITNCIIFLLNYIHQMLVIVFDQVQTNIRWKLAPFSCADRFQLDDIL